MRTKRNRFGTGIPALLAALCVLAGAFTGCTRELTEEQSAALVALQNAVTYYESTGDLKHWEDLVALAAANRADGIGVNWNALTLPETPEVPILEPAPQSQPEGGDGTVDNNGLEAGQIPGNPAGPDGQAEGDLMPEAPSWTPVDVSAYPGAIFTSILKGEDYSVLSASLAAAQNPANGAFSETYINQHIWSMITLTAAASKEGYDYDRAASYLLTFQKEDGGFGYSLDSAVSDMDLTGAAAVALAPYYDKHKKTDEMKALTAYLKEKQLEDGGYENAGAENPSTIACAIWGLTALNRGMPSTEEGLTPVDALLAYQNEDGSFRSQKDGEHVADAISTRQAVIALCDVVNDMNTYILLAEDAESYRIENISGPAITLSVDFPDEAENADISAPFMVEEGSSALDALILYGKIKEIPVSVSGTADSRYVQSIGGAAEKSYGDTSGWIFKINDQPPQQGAAAAVLQEGDVLSWIFIEQADETIMQ